MAELPPPQERIWTPRRISAWAGSCRSTAGRALCVRAGACARPLLALGATLNAKVLAASSGEVPPPYGIGGYSLAGILVFAVVGGGALGAVLAVRHANHRRQRELAEAARAHEAQILELFDNLPLECWALDREGKYTLVNPHSRSSWQLPGEEQGKPLRHLQESPELVERWKRSNLRAFSGEVVRDEFTSRRSGVPRHYYSIVSPMRKAGKITGIIGVNIEITDRVRTERAWHETERRLAEHIRQTPLAVIEWSIDAMVTSWNPAAESLFGYSPDEAKGRSASDLIIPSAEREDFATLWRKLKEGGRSAHVTSRNRTMTGRRISCEWWHSPLKDADGRSVGVISFAQDVTDRLELEERLQQAKQLESMSRLAAGVAQEFDSFLTPLLRDLNSLRGDEITPEQLQEGLAKFRVSALQARELVDRTLAVAGKVTEEPVWASLNELVRMAMDTLRTEIDQQVDLVLNIDAPLPSLQVRRRAVLKIVGQLVRNANDALIQKSTTFENSAWQPRMIVSTGLVERDRTIQGRASRNRYQMVAVTDNGRGIEPGIQASIFEPFFTTKGMGGGHGLGLAEVWRLAESSGGWVEVESAQGRGSTFWVFFPETKSESPFLPVATTWQAPPEGKSSAVDLLLVEDNFLVSQALAEMLTDAGHRVTTAADGDEAWALLESRAQPFQLVVSDLNLPGLSGRQVLELMASHGMTLPVLLISGYCEAEEFEELMQLGAKALLKKPVQTQQLLALIAEHAQKVSSS